MISHSLILELRDILENREKHSVLSKLEIMFEDFDNYSITEFLNKIEEEIEWNKKYLITIEEIKN